jgi:outer membrane protein OmpA-like peptidoglycan-associated protein
MLGLRSSRRSARKDEAEKPFWISFSDLMTALMVLFLVAMAVALIAVTHGLATIKKGEEARESAIRTCMASISMLTVQPEFRGVKVHETSLDFGTLVLFGDNQHTFERPSQAAFVRRFVPRVLDVARRVECDQWLKRVVVEGFASKSGDYLYNLNLSYLRSQRVLCVLLDSRPADAISKTDRKLIQTLFLVGGSSFNTVASTAAQMRRVELKLEFREFGTSKDAPVEIPLDPGLQCPNDSR